MSNIQQIQSHIEKAREIRESATGNYRRSLDSYRSGKARINRLFPKKGNKQANSIFDRKSRRELFRQIQNESNQYKSALNAAAAAAEKIAHSAAPRPAEEIVERFERRLADVRTEILIAPTSETANQRLCSFIASINEPWAAMRVKQEYGELVRPIIESAGNQAGSFKIQLSSAFEELKAQALTEEARQAVALADTAEAMLQSSLYPAIVKDTISQTLGRRAAAFVDSPDEYFTSQEFAENELKSKDEELQLETALMFAEAR